MKKFSKLIAVVLAIAVIICPMMSVVSHATTTNGYKIEAIDANNLKLTISSTDGFVAYHATVGFNSNTAFQSNYTDANTGYTDGLKVISYTLKTAEADTHNAPAISANASGTSLNVIVMPSDINNLDLCTEIVIGIRVADGTTATLTKIQAADNGTVDSEDANLLTFPAANESTGEIDQTAEYATENATTAHTHELTLVPAVPATCTAAGNSAYYTCSGCDKIFSDSEGTTETTLQDVTIAATGHTVVNDPAVAATCTETGLTAGSHCSVCNTVLVAQETVPATGHTPAEAVVENNVAATCTTAGSYDSVVYCSVCNAEISRETVNVPATGHTPATAVEENRVEATCGVAGHYDSVVYCSECDAEISRETIVIPATGNHTWGEWTIDADGHSRTCSVCNAVDSGTHDGSPCSVCGYEAQAVCTHNYVGVVTTQPTKTSTGVMTYTCTECGDSYTEDIAIPTLNNTVTFKHTLNVSAVVSDEITVSTKQMRTAYGEGATYFIDINYQKYSAYNIVNRNKVLTTSDRLASASTANKDTLYFKDMALYEMTLSFDMTIYFKNAEGVVVGYRTFTSSIADMAVDLALTANDALKTALADMCNYGATAQAYFATANPGTDICSATLPTTIFADYMSYASDVSVLPEAGEYDNTKIATQKIVASTGFISAGMTLNVGASNRIEYTVRYDNYDAEDCQIVMTYTSLYGEKEFEVDMSELIANGTTSAGKPKYIYRFGDLAIYDVNAVVTMNMYHNGVLEAQSQYSVGNFVNTYFNDANLGPVMKAMELFANSTAIALGQGSIF